MIVVSNTSPLTNLAAIGQFDLLHQLFQELHIAEGVWQELNAGGHAWPGSREVANASWIHRHEPGDQALMIALEENLDRGEAETIALALELSSDAVLIDELEGRHSAQRQGLKVLGTLGILLDAKARGLLFAVRPHLEALRDRVGFYLSPPLYEHVLRLANEE